MTETDPTAGPPATVGPADPQTSYGMRYQALNAPDADPADPHSWTEYVNVVESELEATDLFNQAKAAYAGMTNIRQIQLVSAPKIPWHVIEEV